jgi:hypothetical protein
LLDAYALLQVTEHATPAEITRAYRDLARRWRPHRVPAADQARAERRRAAVDAAHDLICDAPLLLCPIEPRAGSDHKFTDADLDRAIAWARVLRERRARLARAGTAAGIAVLASMTILAAAGAAAAAYAAVGLLIASAGGVALAARRPTDRPVDAVVAFVRRTAWH